MNNVKKYKFVSSVVIAIAVVLVIVVNVFVSVLNNKLPLKIDLTSNKMYELSDKTKEYLVTSDDSTSKVKSLKTCKITVDNDEAEAIVEKISEAVKNDSVWEEKDIVQFNKEGNYIVLALVEDNV